MNAIITTNRLRQLSFVTLAAALALFVTALPSQAQNLLVDPGFENPALTPFIQILGPPFATGVWGGENCGNVPGPVFGVNPAGGARMHQQNNAGGVATQSWQLVNVSAFSPQINAGLASFAASALYNVPQDVAAGAASISVSYLNGAFAPVAPVFTSVGAVLDNNPATWQPINVSAPVPPTTQYLRLQVAYANASLVNSAGVDRPGFVDNASLVMRIVPEPATIGLGALALVGLVLAARRR
jgi:hypothetical protein